MRMFRRGQGATEYLLMLAAVLVIVAIAVYYVTSSAPSAIITGTATLDGTDVIFTPSTSMTPATIAAADWNWTIYHGADNIGGGNATGSLERGVPVTLSGATSPASGDVVKIEYKGTLYDAATIA